MSSIAPPIPLPSLGIGLAFELIVLLILLIIGIVIIIIIAKVLFFFLPAAIIALVVWLLSGSLFWAGVAFLVIAFISVAKRK